ncbi:ATP-grasp domain-containing protein [Mycobacterium aquaticum]|uniref:Alpha-L-glutamate ligase n=1 Tax=Mycobacterium aquaticum TaxID=1927124 RepID=A0A1X0A318_9MYCO|nr:alpha-L-glutamate ligase [Mycobacterium aquaticum]ORA24392.1 alpha-L-glutamate ligase [Mycobacterium aquaticum]
MIVFYGYPDDRPLERAIDAAADLGLDYLVIDQRHAAHSDMCLEVRDGDVRGRLVVSGSSIRIDEIEAVYARPLTTPMHGDQRERERARAFDDVFIEWLDVADCLVVSRPAAMHSNASKPFQAQEIAACGFSVPDTLVSTDPERVREFWARHGSVVFKSISGIRSIVRPLDEQRAAGLDRVRDLPTQFQELVEGVDVRVHVVGQQVFATEISSSVVDYRYAHRDGATAVLTPVELPQDVAARCVELSARLDLPFAGIDLRRRPDGDHVCFEVNPMPGYSYFEAEAGQPISTALVEFLAGKAA